MKCCLVFVLLLISALKETLGERVFITAPNVFHLGVKEKVLVQVGGQYLNKHFDVYLENLRGNVISERKSVICSAENIPATVELLIERDKWSEIKGRIPYLNLVAEIPSKSQRTITRVLVSNHRGYIFIQTDQPMYNPTQKVKYRIFALNHMFRPHEETVYISVFNAAGNRLVKNRKRVTEGILQDHFDIPHLSEMGTFKITAHYEGDEANAAVREFKVQRFVLPSFEVRIETEQHYILLADQQLDFAISAMYSYGEEVKGGYHCQFGVKKNGALQIIRGLKLTGSVRNGRATATLQLKDIDWKQLNTSLTELQKSGSQLYIGVFVTNIQSGEVQQGEIYLPIFSHKYNIDLSRTRSHFIPGVPLDVVVVVRHPDGTPAVRVPVNISTSASKQQFHQGTTDQDGGLFHTFNIISTSEITVDVSTDGLQRSKHLTAVSSPGGSYLYISLTNKVYNMDETFSVTFNTINGPSNGYIYYLVLSRGMIIQSGSLPHHGSEPRRSIKHNLRITANMVPAFRLIGYYHSKNDDIIADSVWVDVRDECEIKVTVQHKGQARPGIQTELELDLHRQTATVALLAVDKAFYGLKADNKLTPKQVFSTMASYDLGCAYSGGSDPEAVLLDAGLAFASQSVQKWRTSITCESQNVRPRRSVDLNEEKIKLKLEFQDADLQICCTHAFSRIPMRESTCRKRSDRVRLVKGNQTCADAFLKCCLAAEKLRQRKMIEDSQSQLGRTAITDLMEDYFFRTEKMRKFFPPSFEFKHFLVNDKKRHNLFLPDSITTWEIQVITLSPETGLCVVKPLEIRAFKETFVSLRLPYSVKKFEQLSISPVIYNYGERNLTLAVHMEQVEGLCSPASTTTNSYTEITVKKHSSQLVSFSVVPIKTGPLPIKIRLYDIEHDNGIDQLQKTLKVQTEGQLETEETTTMIKLDGRSSKIIYIDGALPDGTVPDSGSNILISMQDNSFGGSYVRNLLSPEKVSKLIVLPYGCLEQTMKRLAPTTLALRYLEMSEQWFTIKPSARDEAFDHLERGYLRITEFEKPNGSYGAWNSDPTSNWVTALVVKILSLIAELQTYDHGVKGRELNVIPLQKINQPVSYLLSVQQHDGSFRDPNPVLHRGVLTGKDEDASMTAFITLALNRSRQFLTTENLNKVETSISKATAYLQSQIEELSHTYAVAITAYCLSEGNDRLRAWKKLQSMAKIDKTNCSYWTNTGILDAITVETTAYALLAAVKIGERSWADKIACWLVRQENYYGGYRSTQDTIMALEALSEYELARPPFSIINVTAEFRIQGKSDRVKLTLAERNETVETDLEKLSGNNITVELTGKGKIKLKSLKTFYLLDPEDGCSKLKITVKVEGKVEYTAKITENYDYYEDYDDAEEKQTRVARSTIEHFDALARSRRDLKNDINSDSIIYTVCVSYSPNSPLTGMGIADITLLSGFEVEEEDLIRLKQPPELYISHYEISSGRVVLYFNKLYETKECLTFTANQKVPVGLLQPAPAVFYDYYEPGVKCTVFYSLPRRSQLVSKLCSEDVCQCAERPCHKVQETFKLGRKITKNKRMNHACFSPTVDYAYIVEVQDVSFKSNFALYKVKITEVLRTYDDLHVRTDSVRVFAKRLHCKEGLELKMQYLIMGKDGATKDSDGNMQYLLESNTWVERKPLDVECKKSGNIRTCNEFNTFIDEYKTFGCRQ
ncbi:PREDICTED: complement C4-B-like [Cyprinodon variegatus]|uniref:complement C4-B-like n=1 Tax=Cyprinodon variegatus TaxID=28743 RepID=UPI00074270F7|nr:PREDICTED: complement C4-B-like [Cyprinodon variegatus]